MIDSPSPDGVITFADGLPGFEAFRQFVLVASPSMAPFTIVQGVDAGAPSFVAIDPKLVARDYAASIDEPDLARLQAEPGHPLLWLALVAAQGESLPTVNLRAPLVINPDRMLGIQVVAADSPYPLDHPLLAG